MDYVAASGEKFTDADILQWAQDAENGFPDYDFEPVDGRPWEVKTEPMVTKTIRVPVSLWNRIEQQARARGVSVSEMAREKLRA
ncbi:ribbon-helix-helix domain-containing protein [Arcanobacterium bovis]|uniref:CopG family transcriptional regulator n=1 Tax=Arcanobacterium bovis TaxID=2529275 RepID=A0A4Q9UZ96_9ACTO|nr:ribbon-helix-helix domain-containing protein [Arcanobacterium bovis]TBW20991.1 CopG family transcriptional regulator [Arcanobacterium bovis]